MMNTLSRARWIWLPEGESLNQHGEFRREFTVPAGAGQVRLFISADSRYTVSVNGVHVNASQYADYPDSKVGDEVDITALTRPGRNVLAVTVHFSGEDSSVYRVGRAGLLFAVEADGQLLAVSDTAVLCRLSRAYGSGDMERVSAQLSFSFRYDATRQDGWQEADYQPGEDWQNAAETGVEPVVYPRPVLPLILEERVSARLMAQGVFTDTLGNTAPCGDRMQQAFLSARCTEQMGLPDAVTLPENGPVTLRADEGDGVYVLLDLGREEAGLLDFELELPRAAEVLVGYGEHLDDLRPRAAVGGRQFAAVYTAKAGRQSFTHYFKRVACRYVMLCVYAPEATLHYVGVRPTRYPVTYRPAFRCADGLHNRIADVSRRTLELCMHEHYEDCPWREQALYAMDSRNQMLFGYYAFGETVFAQASLRLLAQGMRPDGLLELCAPARVGVVIPAFSLAFITAVAEQVTYSGDVDFAESMLPTVERILDTFLSRRSENGLTPGFVEAQYWNFYEWRQGLDGGAIWRDGAIGQTWDAPLNGWLLLALKAATELYERLGQTSRSRAYRREYEALCEAVEAFWDEEKQLYATCLSEQGLGHYAQLTQALLICAGAVPAGRLQPLLKKLATDESLVPVTLSHSIYKYDALMSDPATYGCFVKDEIGRIWGDMLFKGATSFWETELGADDFAKAGSLCHGWSAVPLYFYYRYVLGEQLDGSVEAPAFCGLYEARREAE